MNVVFSKYIRHEVIKRFEVMRFLFIQNTACVFRKTVMQPAIIIAFAFTSVCSDIETVFDERRKGLRRSVMRQVTYRSSESLEAIWTACPAA